MKLYFPNKISTWSYACLSICALLFLAYYNFGPRPDFGSLIPSSTLKWLGLSHYWVTKVINQSDKIAHIISGSIVSVILLTFTQPGQTTPSIKYYLKLSLIILTLYVSAELFQYLIRSYLWCFIPEPDQTRYSVWRCRELYFSIKDINASLAGYLITISIHFLIKKYSPRKKTLR